MKTMEPSEIKQSEIRLSDMDLSAFLLTLGHPIAGIEGPAGRRQFVFKNVPRDAVVAFYGGDDRVSARALLNALRNVKGLLAQAL